jgi:hypothetical protein
MTLVTAQMSVSMDGFYAGPKHDTDPQRWMDGHATLVPDYRSMTAELASIQAPLA